MLAFLSSQIFFTIRCNWFCCCEHNWNSSMQLLTCSTNWRIAINASQKIMAVIRPTKCWWWGRYWRISFYEGRITSTSSFCCSRVTAGALKISKSESISYFQNRIYHEYYSSAVAHDFFWYKLHVLQEFRTKIWNHFVHFKLIYRPIPKSYNVLPTELDDWLIKLSFKLSVAYTRTPLND